ncbi:hypothetical protein, partial [Streptomyces tailanensis]|uniref:hypothetical protein n=1 Tax=Streptomyces tailanensis TaxID=2569858 RepID=UPI00155B3F50
KTGTVDPSKGTASTSSTGTTTSGGNSGGDEGAVQGKPEGCASWGVFSGVCSTVGEAFYGVVSNVPHTAEYAGWIFDSDCRGGGGPGSPGCDYGAQFDNWVAGHGYDINSDTYQVPSALAAIFGHRTGPMRPGPKSVWLDRHGRLTNGTYTVDNEKMAKHLPGREVAGRSVFLKGVDAEKAALDAAKFADKNNLWTGDQNQKAKVYVENGPIGVVGRTGELTSYINVYRKVTKQGVTIIHASPGGAP